MRLPAVVATPLGGGGGSGGQARVRRGHDGRAGRSWRCLRPTWRGGAFSYFRWTVRSAWRSGGSILATAEARHAHPQVGGGTGFRVGLTLDPPRTDPAR